MLRAESVPMLSPVIVTSIPPVIPTDEGLTALIVRTAITPHTQSLKKSFSNHHPSETHTYWTGLIKFSWTQVEQNRVRQ